MTSSSPKKSPDQGERREKPNDWLGPQNGSGDSFPSGEINNKKVNFLDMVRRRQNQKPSTPGEEDEKISARHEEAIFFKPVLKIAESLLVCKRRKILHRNSIKENKISTLGTVSPYIQFYIPSLSLSLSQFEGKRKKRKEEDIYGHGLFIYYIFDTLKVYLFV